MASKCLVVGDLMRCPCRHCSNQYYRYIDLVEYHLYMNGIERTYTRWIFHGKKDLCRVNVTSNTEMVDRDGPINIEIKDDMHLPEKENDSSWSRKISEVVYNHCDLH